MVICTSILWAFFFVFVIRVIWTPGEIFRWGQSLIIAGAGIWWMLHIPDRLTVDTEKIRIRSILKTIDVPLNEIVSIEKVDRKELQGAWAVGLSRVVKRHDRIGCYHDLGTHRRHLVLISAGKQYVISCREPEVLRQLVKEIE
jgi:hypothetical protein